MKKSNSKKKGFTPLEPRLRWIVIWQTKKPNNNELDDQRVVKKNSKIFFRQGVLTGFTIIEVIVAIFIVLVGLIGGMAAISRTIALTSISSSQLTAAYLCQEGIEIVRNIRDGNWLEQRAATTTSWAEGLSGCSAGCEADYTILGAEDPGLSPYYDRKLKINPATGFYNYVVGAETKFKRKITITSEGGDILKVVVEVTWQEKGRPYSFSAQEKLYKWW